MAGSGGSAGLGGFAGSSGGCSGNCDDGFNCTIDACQAGKCEHSIGPNTGATACPPGQYCTIDKGCVTSPVCATDQECKDAFKGDACKANARCDPKSSLCLFDILDKDHDGHPPQACGGGDCDDSDPQIHPGAQDLCNGKDDDCDGGIDQGATCSDTLKSCQMGSCECKPQNTCGAACIDIAIDPKHCGGCDKPCFGLTTICQNGTCIGSGTVACGGPYTDCGGTSNRCFDLQQNNLNCGTCGSACSGGKTCVSGVCQIPPKTHDRLQSCSSSVKTYCETRVYSPTGFLAKIVVDGKCDGSPDAMHTLEYQYDVFGRVTTLKHTPGVGMGSCGGYIYDSNGNLGIEWATYSDCITPLNPGSTGIVYTYDTNKGTMTETLTSSCTTYTYDASKRLISSARDYKCDGSLSTDSDDACTEYAYDSYGRLASDKWTQKCQGSPLCTAYGYDANWQLVKESYGCGGSPGGATCYANTY
jgi:hypothetical protein